MNDKHNEMLMQKIIKMVRESSPTVRQEAAPSSPNQLNSRFSLNRQNRINDLTRIIQENKAMYDRIQDAKTFYAFSGASKNSFYSKLSQRKGIRSRLNVEDFPSNCQMEETDEPSKTSKEDDEVAGLTQALETTKNSGPTSRSVSRLGAITKPTLAEENKLALSSNTNGRLRQ